jgi:hypothetical protein
VVVLCSAVALSFCGKPVEPSLQPQPAVDAAKQIRAIQLETERQAKQVSQRARSQMGRDVEKALKELARGPGSGGSGQLPDGGELGQSVPTEEIAGKLERATPGLVVIRDHTGFAYWLRASGNLQVTLNGQPARLTDVQQGADVRAVFTWQGKERVATEVELLSGQLLDGGIDGGS